MHHLPAATLDRSDAVGAGFGDAVDGHRRLRDDHPGRAGGRSGRPGATPGSTPATWPRRPPGPAGSNCRSRPAIRGQGVRTDPARAVAAARAYLAASDVTGTVQLRGGTTVVVHTTATYHTTFLGIIGIDRLHGDRHRRVPHGPRRRRGRTMTTLRRRRLTGLARRTAADRHPGRPAGHPARPRR